MTVAVRSMLQEISYGEGTLLDVVDALAAANNPDDAVDLATDDFERIAGPIDRLQHSLLQLEALLLVASPKEQSVVSDVGSRMRNLYKRVVGAVLTHVTNHAETGSWDSMNAVADAVVARAKVDGRVDVFTLNYDALLDSALLHRKSAGGDFTLADEFRGYGEWDIPVLMKTAGIQFVRGHPWREEVYDLEPPSVWLHHLHGAATWMIFQGRLFKAKSLDIIRSGGLFEAWAFGMEGQGGQMRVEPLVLLGDQKERAVTVRPFVEAYESLAVSLQSSETLL